MIRIGRLAILKVYLAAMGTRGRLDLDALAEATAGYSGGYSNVANSADLS